jgi:hypothetical protein
VDTFEFWCPDRRPGGHNVALTIDGGIPAFGVENIRNGLQRPTHQPNAWVANPDDPNPTITLSWPTKQTISRIELSFDTDFDHPLETVIMLNPETASPFCVHEYLICNDQQDRIHHQTDNHQSRRTIRFSESIETGSLTIHLKATNGNTPAALPEIRCYA